MIEDNPGQRVSVGCDPVEVLIYLVYLRSALIDDFSCSLVVLGSEIKWIAGGERREQCVCALRINGVACEALLLERVCDAACEEFSAEKVRAGLKGSC